MPLLHILLVIIIAGVVLYLVNNFIPMSRNIKKILNIVVVVILIVWLLNVFGVFSNLGHYHI
ncbi:MAG: Thivi_2564 family membrane protein [Bacteroidales bacterium]